MDGQQQHCAFTDPADLGNLLDRCGHVFTHRFGRRKQRREQLLQIIADTPGISQKELAEHLHIQPASLSELIIKLELKGLVSREKNEDDRRSIQVRLTPAGFALLQQPQDGKPDPFAVLTQEERLQLTELLKRLSDSWDAQTQRKEDHP